MQYILTKLVIWKSEGKKMKYGLCTIEKQCVLVMYLRNKIQQRPNSNWETYFNFS